MDIATEPIVNIDTSYARRSASGCNIDLFACYQCGKCSNGCPVTFAMDYMPHQLIRMLQLGLTEEVLRSKTIWVCASCETCTTRCPNEIEIAKLMDDLKHRALEDKQKPTEESIVEFHKVFLNNIRMFGRVNETALMGVYQMKSTLRDLKTIKFNFSGTFKTMKLGLNMLKRGRLSLFPRWKGRKAVKELFKES